MIPALLLVGLAIGAFVHDPRSAGRATAIVVVGASVWGVVIGVADGDLETLVAAAALGLGNLIVGALIAASIRGFAHRAGSSTTTSWRVTYSDGMLDSNSC